MDEPDVRKLARRQQTMLAILQAKVLRQRAYINRLIEAESSCVYRVEAELLREELAERNSGKVFVDGVEVDYTGIPGSSVTEPPVA
jgi:hypothetical protein